MGKEPKTYSTFGGCCGVPPPVLAMGFLPTVYALPLLEYNLRTKGDGSEVQHLPSMCKA